MKAEIFNESSAVGRGWGSIFHHTAISGAWYRDGMVATASGYVIVYCEKEHASFRFIYRGRLYMRSYRRSFSNRGLITKAKQFASEIVTEVEAPFGGV